MREAVFDAIAMKKTHGACMNRPGLYPGTAQVTRPFRCR